jgi:hypothetical protein
MNERNDDRAGRASRLLQGRPVMTTKRKKPEPERRRWRPADREVVVAALNRTEEQIIRITRSENDALSNFTREREDND